VTNHRHLLKSKLASFLGDPNFPKKITSKFTSRGERIIFYQKLYMQYSRLAFTKWEDRPIAIAGLEKQLRHDLDSKGGFGVFDDGKSFLRRSLLWQRGEDEATLRRISFPPERKITVPSWSWMGDQGGIDFLSMELGGVEWQKGEIHSPWGPDVSEASHPEPQTANVELSAIAREFNPGLAKPEEVLIVYDIPETELQSVMCIVMGKEKRRGNAEDARHYVLLIGPKDVQAKVYERVGVGFMPGSCIQLDATGVSGLVKVR
jgi:hypothetical protein